MWFSDTDNRPAGVPAAARPSSTTPAARSGATRPRSSAPSPSRCACPAARAASTAPATPRASPPLEGSPEHLADELRAYADEGIAHVQLVVDPIDRRSVEGLAPMLTALDAQPDAVLPYGADRGPQGASIPAPCDSQRTGGRVGWSRRSSSRSASSARAAADRRLRRRRSPSPTPLITPDPHLGDPTTADAVFLALAAAGLRMTANNADAGGAESRPGQAHQRDVPRLAAGGQPVQDDGVAGQGARLGRRRQARPGRAAGRHRRPEHPHRVGSHDRRRAADAGRDARLDGLRATWPRRSMPCCRRCGPAPSWPCPGAGTEGRRERPTRLPRRRRRRRPEAVPCRAAAERLPG